MDDFRLKVFVSVCKNKSFSKASQELHLSQPAVSRHIKELEEIYQCRLFDRMGNRIEVTKEGRQMLQSVFHILDAYQQLDFSMQTLLHKYKGNLLLGASTTIAQYVLPKLLSSFMLRHPEVQINMSNDNTRHIQQALLDRRIDVGLIEGPVTIPNLHYISWMKDELVPVVHRNSKWANVEEITLLELQQIPLVVRELGSGTLDVIELALKQKELTLQNLNVIIQLGSTESIKNFLYHKDCMAIVSIQSVLKELKEGIFQVVEIPELKMERSFNIVQLQGPENGLVKEFVDSLLAFKI